MSQMIYFRRRGWVQQHKQPYMHVLQSTDMDSECSSHIAIHMWSLPDHIANLVSSEGASCEVVSLHGHLEITRHSWETPSVNWSGLHAQLPKREKSHKPSTATSMQV